MPAVMSPSFASSRRMMRRSEKFQVVVKRAAVAWSSLPPESYSADRAVALGVCDRQLNMLISSCCALG